MESEDPDLYHAILESLRMATGDPEYYPHHSDMKFNILDIAKPSKTKKCGKRPQTHHHRDYSLKRKQHKRKSLAKLNNQVFKTLTRLWRMFRRRNSKSGRTTYSRDLCRTPRTTGKKFLTSKKWALSAHRTPLLFAGIITTGEDDGEDDQRFDEAVSLDFNECTFPVSYQQQANRHAWLPESYQR